MGHDQVGGERGEVMRRVILESPYAASAGRTVEENVAFARLCMADSIKRNESPVAFHLLFPQVMDENDPDQRHHAMQLASWWLPAADAVVVYTDRGITRGMGDAITAARAADIPVELRKLGE